MIYPITTCFYNHDFSENDMFSAIELGYDINITIHNNMRLEHKLCDKKINKLHIINCISTNINMIWFISHLNNNKYVYLDKSSLFNYFEISVVGYTLPEFLCLGGAGFGSIYEYIARDNLYNEIYPVWIKNIKASDYSYIE